MKRNSTIQTVLLLMLVAWFTTACDAYNEYEQYRQVKKAQDATRAFTPTYYKDTQRRHLVVYFEIADGRLRPSARPAERRPGKLPYRSASAGNVLVVYRDADGKELGRYATEDPMLVRSCDSEHGLVGELKRLSDGVVIEVLLPDDARIRSVAFGRPNEKPLTFPIGRQIDDSRQTRPSVPPG
jgi:hypothetical protein